MIARRAAAADIRHVLRNPTDAGRAEALALLPDDDIEPAIERLIFATASPFCIAHWALAPQEDAPAAALIGAWQQSPGVARLYGAITPVMLGRERAWGLLGLRRFVPQVLGGQRLALMSVMVEGQAAWLAILRRIGFTPHGAPLPYGRRGEPFQDMVWINDRPAVDACGARLVSPGAITG
jgi:hypothetical protein